MDACALPGSGVHSSADHYAPCNTLAFLHRNIFWESIEASFCGFPSVYTRSKWRRAAQAMTMFSQSSWCPASLSRICRNFPGIYIAFEPHKKARALLSQKRNVQGGIHHRPLFPSGNRRQFLLHKISTPFFRFFWADRIYQTNIIPANERIVFVTCLPFIGIYMATPCLCVLTALEKAAFRE